MYVYMYAYMYVRIVSWLDYWTGIKWRLMWLTYKIYEIVLLTNISNYKTCFNEKSQIPKRSLWTRFKTFMEMRKTLNCSKFEYFLQSKGNIYIYILIVRYWSILQIPVVNVFCRDNHNYNKNALFLIRHKWKTTFNLN